MALSAGARVGPYEIVKLLGAGGMGEVYEAHDRRLGRDVAIKVLRGSFATDSDGRQRLEREARAVAAISHPNILAVFDVGTFGVDTTGGGASVERGVFYVVTELLQGTTLRARLESGRLAVATAIDLAAQIADGLAAAHARGIIHRDIKPENLFVTADGRAKILDFGLAKDLGPLLRAATDTTTVAPVQTASGVVLGTVGYMAPEQIRAEPIDARTDLFAFGCVLYEMLTGRRAFRGPTSIDTLGAILRDPPPPIAGEATALPPALVRIVQRCLEKAPAARFQSASDLAFALRQTASASPAVEAPTRRPSSQRWWLLASAGVTIVAATLGWVARLLSTPPVAPATWKQLTFRRGFVHNARLLADGKTVAYSAAWDGNPMRVFNSLVDSQESRQMDLAPAGLLAVSRTGEIAVSQGCRFTISSATCPGTLAVGEFMGGTPRPLQAGVLAADWMPDGSLAIAIQRPGHIAIESPSGIVISERGQGQVRASPRGRLAWSEFAGDTSVVSIMVRDERGTRALSTGWSFVSGLAWAPDDSSLYFSALSTKEIGSDLVVRVTLDGHERPVLRSSGRLRVLDVTPDGSLLIDRSLDERLTYLHELGAANTVRDLSWFGQSSPQAVSMDGAVALISERLHASPADVYPLFLRPLDGTSPVRLGSGYGMAISPDNAWALAETRAAADPSVFVLQPLATGSARQLDSGGLRLDAGQSAASFVDNSRIVFRARPAVGAPQRTYVQSLDGGPPRVLDHEPGAIVSPVSTNGRFVARRADGSLWVTTLDGASAVKVPAAVGSGDTIIQWASGGREVFVSRPGADRLTIRRIDLDSGRETTVITLTPRVPTEFLQYTSAVITPDGQHLLVGESLLQSTLYLVQGAK